MSYNPRPLGCFCPEAWAPPPALALYQAYFPSSASLLVPEYFSFFPPLRAAYSHSASVGRRYFFPVLAFNLPMNAWISFQPTCSTGHFSPQFLKNEGLLPITDCH